MADKQKFAFDKVNFIFSVRRIKVAPAVCLFGFLWMIYAVLRKPKTNQTDYNNTTDINKEVQ